LSKGRFHIFLAIKVALIFSILLALDSLNSIEQQLIHPLEYQTRLGAGKAPKQSSRLVIFSIRNSTKSSQSQEISAKEWLWALQQLAPMSPRAVIIAHDLELAGDPDEDVVKIRRFVENSNLSLWTLIEAEKIVTLGQWQYSAGTDRGTQSQSRFSDDRSQRWVDAHPLIKSSLAGQGHWEFSKNGRPMSWINISGDERVGFLGLSDAQAAHQLSFLPNLIESSELRVSPLRAATESAANFPPKGATILLVKDEVDASALVTSPFGPLPRQLVLASVVNSTLTQQYLKTPTYVVSVLLIFLWVFVGAAWPGQANRLHGNYWIPITRYSAIVFGFSLSAAAIGLLTFTYFGWVIPWVYMVLGSTTAFIGVKSRILYKTRQRQQQLKACLGIGEEVARQIAHLPPEIIFRTRAQPLTHLSVRLTGVQAAAQKFPPDQVIPMLANHVTLITQIVEAHGGAIKKPNHDALVCTFGLFSSDPFPEEDAKEIQNVVACALAIQEHIIFAHKTVSETNGLIFPVQIGIDHQPAYVGNVGQAHRLDLAMISEGQSHAALISEKCPRYHVLANRSIGHAIGSMSLGDETVKEACFALEGDQKIETFLQLRPQGLKDQDNRYLTEHFARIMGLRRSEERWDICDRGIKVDLDGVYGEMLEISPSGAKIVSRARKSSGEVIKLSLSTSSQAINGLIADADLSPVSARVMWAHTTARGTMVGVRFLADEAHLARLFALLFASVDHKPELRQAG
jgi:class 3 adenylate cyclase